MLAGFLSAMRTLAPVVTFSSSVPFPLPPLQARFPEINWLPYDPALRARAISECDVWLGLGGSPFQHALSRWFLDHLVDDASVCHRAGKPMFFLGIGVQSRAELDSPDVRRLVANSSGIWTRDPGSADLINAAQPAAPLTAATDLAHILLRSAPPPPAKPGRLTAVANFDYQGWPGQAAFFAAARAFPARERIWLAQESRELPGAERALHASLPEDLRAAWSLVVPDIPGPLAAALARWPSGEWLLTARYHAALAGAWAGSKIVVIATNEKLRAAARELRCPTVSPSSSAAEVKAALAAATPAPAPQSQAEQAYAACAAFVRAVGSARGVSSFPGSTNAQG